MIVLHISKAPNNPCNGVVAVVPQHVAAQGKFADTALINLNGIALTGCERQLLCDIDALPKPYDRPDLVVFHEVYKPEFLRAAGKWRKMGVPYIVVPHGCLTKKAQRIKRLKKTVANLLLVDRFLRGAKAIQFLSRQEQENSRFREKGFVATSGIDLPKNNQRQTDPERVRMVYIGRMDIHVKGLDLMLQAVRDTAELLRANRATLDLYGPDRLGSHEVLRKMIAELGIGDLVAVHDKVLGEEKAAVLRRADIFIQTSRTEALTMGILEAMSYGLPCIVTEGTTRAELIRDRNAGWSAQNDARAIAETIRSAMMQKETWLQKGQKATEIIAEDYGWDRIARKTVLQYRLLLK